MQVGIQGAADTTIENCESSIRTGYSYRSIVTLFLCIYPLIVSKTYFSSGSLTSLFRKPLTICLVVLSAAPFPLCWVFTTYSSTNGLTSKEHTSAIQLNNVSAVLS